MRRKNKKSPNTQKQNYRVKVRFTCARCFSPWRAAVWDRMCFAQFPLFLVTLLLFFPLLYLGVVVSTASLSHVAELLPISAPVFPGDISSQIRRGGREPNCLFFYSGSPGRSRIYIYATQAAPRFVSACTRFLWRFFDFERFGGCFSFRFGSARVCVFVACPSSKSTCRFKRVRD